LQLKESEATPYSLLLWRGAERGESKGVRSSPLQRSKEKGVSTTLLSVLCFAKPGGKKGLLRTSGKAQPSFSYEERKAARNEQLSKQFYVKAKVIC
jgi:hypothetical protein